MNVLASLRTIWFMALQFSLLSICIVWLAVWQWGWNVAILLLLPLIWASLRFWRSIKHQLVEAIPQSIEYLPARIVRSSPLDRDSIRRYTTALKRLGFVPVKDFKLAPESGGNAEDFARLFCHPQHYCYAQVFQSCPSGGQPSPVHCSILSYFKHDWSLATTQQKQNGLTFMFHQPKICWVYYANALPAELLSAHLERRQAMATALKIDVSEEMSWDFYDRQEQHAMAMRRQILKRRNIIFMLFRATWFELRPLSEWLGDYRKIAAQKQQSKFSEF